MSSKYFKNKEILQYYLLVVLIYIFTLQFALQIHIPLVRYWDELYAAIYIPLICIKFYNKNVVKKEDIILLGAVLIYIASGLYSNIIYEYQTPIAVAYDIFLNLKFIMAIYATYWLFKGMDIYKYKNNIKRHIKIIITALFFMLVLNNVYQVFPVVDKRHGIWSQMLIFNHPTELASVSFFLILLLTLFYNRKSKDKYYLIMALVLVISSLRDKAIATAAIFVVLFYIVVIRQRKIGIKQVAIPGILACAVGWKQFFFYFFSSSSRYMARGALAYTGLKIAYDYMPFGTGFGTFASYSSAKYYSCIYELYGINKVSGLSKSNADLASDAYWPMVIGQCGIIGLICIIVVLYILFCKIQKLYEVSKTVYLAGIGVMLYLLISSVAESAFVNPLSIALALVLGLTFSIFQNVKQQNVKSEELNEKE